MDTLKGKIVVTMISFWNFASIQTRTKIKSGCPYCAGKMVNKSNCLTTTHPEIASEWHPTKNGDLTADKVTKGSKRRIIWLCPKNKDHIYTTEVKN
ncbi:MAG: hypothetical protein HeimC3_16620 [Candidatus Heimdallarchaeota archaeon LC_3]|nr:MAG: hypothetical protein HeimC3_16620 [Candidatus Heimdallarchaeota archaeon LC_3]